MPWYTFIFGTDIVSYYWSKKNTKPTSLVRLGPLRRLKKAKALKENMHISNNSKPIPNPLTGFFPNSFAEELNSSSVRFPMKRLFMLDKIAGSIELFVALYATRLVEIMTEL
jgi:hypothetical protein